ncbi:MAG: tRNA modification GTPase [Planctomycetes bacterium]|nr:tRNA modification GTPase [Planctomycetota bacterium]
MDDTIAAIASPPGGAFRGILRLSGPGVIACLQRCFRSEDTGGLGWNDSMLARVLSGRMIIPPPIHDLPCDVYFWPGPRSFTRQTVAEIHTIGSPPLLEAALSTVCAAGARLARPGEFTMRAFLAGRLDLTQAEAVLGVIDARNRRQLESALGQLAGGLAQPLHELRDRLLDLLADVEAGLDFVDEDIQFVSDSELEHRLGAAAERLDSLNRQMSGRSQTAELCRVVLVGCPNVGKSSLMNALVNEQAAIVADTAGTTRDYLTRRASFQGLDCLLVDTAGVQVQTTDSLAAAAQALGIEQAQGAHLQLWCIDATRHLNQWERAALVEPAPAPRLLVLTKTDQLISTDLHAEAVPTSSQTGAGLDLLRQAIFEILSEQMDSEAGIVAQTALRCRESLRGAAESLQRAREYTAGAAGDEVVAAEIRIALDELAQVVGAVYTEDILDRIFSRFCIGK